jgi:hypothetical protein
MFHHRASDGEEPLAPLGQGEFARSILHDLTAYLPMADDDTFDGELMRHKIHYVDKKVKDYRTKEIRYARASDRARFHTHKPYEELTAPEELKELWKSTVQLMAEFWKAGGTTFDDEKAECIVNNLEKLAHSAEFHLLKAVHCLR